MTTALHFLLLSFTLLLVPPTTATDYRDLRDDYYKLCKDYTADHLTAMKKELERGFHRINFFAVLDNFTLDAEKFETLKRKISKSTNLTGPYAELDNAIRSDLITLVALSERRARQTAFLARATFDEKNEEHQDSLLRNLAMDREILKELLYRISQNGHNGQIEFITIVSEGHQDITRYCDMAKQVQAIDHFFKKADIRGGNYDGGKYESVDQALKAFQMESDYNEGKYEEGGYERAAEKADYGAKYVESGYRGNYGAVDEALEEFKSMRTRDDHPPRKPTRESPRHMYPPRKPTLTFGALDKLLPICKEEAQDKTISGYASAMINLEDKEVKKAATNLENVADAIKTIWKFEDFYTRYSDPLDTKEALQIETMEILDDRTTVADIGKAYDALRDMPEKTAEADKMLTNIGAIAKAIRDFVEECDEFHHPLIAAFESAIAKKEHAAAKQRKTKAAATMTGSSAAAQAKVKAHRARRNKGRRNRRRRQRARN